MMADYEYTFAVTLSQKLKHKIAGGNHVCVTDNDELLVKIIRDGAVDFKVYICNFSEKIRNGWSTDYAAYEIVNAYKDYIMKKYFY